MRSRAAIGVYVLCAFFTLNLGIAFFFNRNFPVLAVAGESSAGTWISGVLLSCCAALTLITAMHRSWYPWVLLTVFFFLLAADEYYMFHERMKEWIMFSFAKPGVIVSESPVILGALIGAWCSWILWNHFEKFSRTFLLSAMIAGIASVILDVKGGSALWKNVLS